MTVGLEEVSRQVEICECHIFTEAFAYLLEELFAKATPGKDQLPEIPIVL